MTAAFDPCFEPVAAIVRGAAVESLHRGVIAIVDPGGALRGGVGDPDTYLLLRSSAKPFQAAAVVASGAAEAFSLADNEIAVMAASHSGAPEHVEVVGRLLARAGISADLLVCGSVEHMCSGKHAGMLLLARHLGVSEDGYHHPDHPVQREIAAYVSSLLENGSKRARRGAGSDPAKAGAGGRGLAFQQPPKTLFGGTDGCGVPVLGMTLYEAAWLFAMLGAGATPALARVRDAMRAHPSLVAGEGRLDTNVMRAGEGRVVSKGGAEGVQGIGLVGAAGGAAGATGEAGAEMGAGPRGGAPGPAGPLGCVIKVEDGSGRAIPALVATFLRAWGASEESAAVEGHHPAAILDRTGREVARIEVLVGSADLRRPPGRGATCEQTGEEGAAAGRPVRTRRRLLSSGVERFTVCRGDEKDVLRFLREQWPAVDREYFGRAVEWSAEPYALVLRQDRKVVAVLRGHFIGGLASVDELMVGEGERGRGLGSTLLGRFEDEARKRRCSKIVLRAVKGSPAEDFYRGRGYHRECVQYGYEFGHDYVRLLREAEGGS